MQAPAVSRLRSYGPFGHANRTAHGAIGATGFSTSLPADEGILRGLCTGCPHRRRPIRRCAAQPSGRPHEPPGDRRSRWMTVPASDRGTELGLQTASLTLFSSGWQPGDLACSFRDRPPAQRLPRPNVGAECTKPGIGHPPSVCRARTLAPSARNPGSATRPASAAPERWRRVHETRVGAIRAGEGQPLKPRIVHSAPRAGLGGVGRAESCGSRARIVHSAPRTGFLAAGPMGPGPESCTRRQRGSARPPLPRAGHNETPKGTNRSAGPWPPMQAPASRFQRAPVRSHRR